MFDVLLPNHAPDSDADKGVVVGPPSLESLGLPRETEIRLHNALYNRGLLTEHDVQARPSEVVASIMSALKVDAQLVMALYSM